MISFSRKLADENPGLSRYELAEVHKATRHARLNEGVYGIIQDPILRREEIRYNPQPTYTMSRNTAKRIRGSSRNNPDIPLDTLVDLRCFFTGVKCNWPVMGYFPPGRNNAPSENPWLGSRDHLVPARRYVPNCPVDVSQYPSALVFCSKVANTTLGLIPLPIRLKIRQWLSTAKYDPLDTSLEAGLNMRWIIVDMLRDFRIKGRLVWSRNHSGQWWHPEVSKPLMEKWWKMEIEFLKLDDQGRHEFIENFVYHY